VIGYLTSATLLEPGGSYRNREAKALRADAEVALEIGPEETPTAFGAGLELVDVGRPPDDFESIVAGNVWHRAVVFGPLRADAPSSATKATVSINGEVRGSAPVPDDVAEAVAIASRLLAAVGERLEPGDRIIAGSLVHLPACQGTTSWSTSARSAAWT
jgi:2-keto-4-pentenoate hydratase